MYQNLFKMYIKKALLVLTGMALCLGLTLLPSDSHALVDSPEPYLVAYLVKDINPTTGEEPQELTNVNGTLFFSAEDGAHGHELWKSDGTAAGTVMVKDIFPGEDSSHPSNLENVNDTLFFSAYDDDHGEELWKSDGTPDGTQIVKDIYSGGGSSPRELIAVNGTLFFNADDGVHGRELWKSDGTEEGTVLVKDILPGSEPLTGPNSSKPQALTGVNGVLFFNAEDFFNGRELWKSDGTPDGTVLVKDINPGGGSSPRELTAVNGTLFFGAWDSGEGLWKSDGTEEGTVLVKDIYADWSGLSSLTDVNGTLFFSADDGVHGNELWKSDGTPDGTVMVKDIYPGGMYVGSYPSYLTDVNGTLFFRAYEPTYSYRDELWKSDGTAEGTVLVKDISPSHLTDVNGTLFFSGFDGYSEEGGSGLELWKSDGTDSGTVMVKDINPGDNDSSSPGWLTNVNGVLFFTADDEVHGRELWALGEGLPIFLPLVTK